MIKNNRNLFIGSLFWLLVLAGIITIFILNNTQKDKLNNEMKYTPQVIQTATSYKAADIIEDMIDQKSQTNTQLNQSVKNTNLQKDKNKQIFWVQISTYAKENKVIAEQMLDQLLNKQIKSKLIESSNDFKLIVGPFDQLNKANIEKNRLKEELKLKDIFVYRQSPKN